MNQGCSGHHQPCRWRWGVVSLRPRVRCRVRRL